MGSAGQALKGKLRQDPGLRADGTSAEPIQVSEVRRGRVVAFETTVGTSSGDVQLLRPSGGRRGMDPFGYSAPWGYRLLEKTTGGRGFSLKVWARDGVRWGGMARPAASAARGSERPPPPTFGEPRRCTASSRLGMLRPGVGSCVSPAAHRPAPFPTLVPQVNRFIVLGLTFLCYTAYHASRKPPSIVKSVLHGRASGGHEGDVHLHAGADCFCWWEAFMSMEWVEREPSLRHAVDRLAGCVEPQCPHSWIGSPRCAPGGRHAGWTGRLLSTVSGFTAAMPVHDFSVPQLSHTFPHTQIIVKPDPTPCSGAVFGVVNTTDAVATGGWAPFNDPSKGNALLGALDLSFLAAYAGRFEEGHGQ